MSALAQDSTTDIRLIFWSYTDYANCAASDFSYSMASADSDGIVSISAATTGTMALNFLDPTLTTNAFKEQFTF